MNISELLNSFHRVEIIEQLVDFITKEPPTDVADAIRFKYSNIACEILTTNKSALSTLLIEHQYLLEKLYAFLEQQPPLNPLLASFFSKTFGMLISKKAEQVRTTPNFVISTFALKTFAYEHFL